MLIKKGKAEIVAIIKDDEHKLDDDDVRKVMNKAAETLKKDKGQTKPDNVVEN